MPKPRKVIRPRRLNLHLPEDLLARLDLMLYSPLEERVPHGAYQEFFEARLREWFERQEK